MTYDPNSDITATIDLLCETFPKAFTWHEARRTPLKVGIFNDIRAVLNGAVTDAELSRALACYTSNKVYRSRLRAGAVRFGLDGLPAGEVTPEQQAHAADWLKAIYDRRCGGVS